MTTGEASKGPLDLDSIEQRAQYVHATSQGKPYALADDARRLVAEVRRLQAVVAQVMQTRDAAVGIAMIERKPSAINTLMWTAKCLTDALAAGGS